MPKTVNFWPPSPLAPRGTPDWASRPVVLDSNVVLDLWLFVDPTLARLRQAVETRQMVWRCAPALHAELLHVLDHRLAKVKSEACTNKPRVIAATATWACMVDDPTPAPAPGLRCTDPDDQPFVDLALAHAPCWLLSRDKAVLKLARRAAEVGVRIAVPLRWVSATAVSRPPEVDTASGA